MRVFKFPVGQLKANCYFAAGEGDNQTVIIDPGGDPDFLIQKIENLNLDPQTIIATHGHFDHILGALHLKLCLDLPFLIHKGDLPLLQKASRSAAYWTNQPDHTPPPEVESFLTDGQKIKIGEVDLEILHTPGHTPGSICLSNPREKILFSGDLIFQRGVGRTDLSYSSPQELEQSLERITRLPKETLVYPGHGKEFKLENHR